MKRQSPIRYCLYPKLFSLSDSEGSSFDDSAMNEGSHTALSGHRLSDLLSSWLLRICPDPFSISEFTLIPLWTMDSVSLLYLIAMAESDAEQSEFIRFHNYNRPWTLKALSQLYLSPFLRSQMRVQVFSHNNK